MSRKRQTAVRVVAGDLSYFWLEEVTIKADRSDRTARTSHFLNPARGRWQGMGVVCLNFTTNE